MSTASRIRPSGLFSRILFDRQDHDLLAIVDDVLHRGGGYSGLKRMLTPHLHPHGIKEMAATKGLRIAYATIHLLGSLESGKAMDRLEALRTLRHEVLTAAESSLRKNTARVLLEIMKRLVRGPSSHTARLRLAHDFRRAVSGKPRIIRSQLKRFHLLEMPEEWNQLAFDDHVHDANTKGRKSPTHLILDAWIKGIRKLTVVHYNFVSKAAAAELLEAAEIMDVSVRIGIEVRVGHGARLAKLLWTPRDVPRADDFLAFLDKPEVEAFMRLGEEVSRHQQAYVWQVLDKYNAGLRREIGEALGVEAPMVEASEFRAFVGVGQPSVHHLGHCLAVKLEGLVNPDQSAPTGELAESIIERWLEPGRNPDLPDPFVPRPGGGEPELLRLDAAEMTRRICLLHDANWLTLDLCGLGSEDMLHLLYACRGRLTHFEVFNLRAFERGLKIDVASALRLQEVVNSSNAVRLKGLVLSALARLSAMPDNESAFLRAGLEQVLDDIPGLLALYRKKGLRIRMGSDSTGQSSRRHGMGFVVADTLPGSARRNLGEAGGRVRAALPLAVEVSPQLTFTTGEEGRKPLREKLWRLMPVAMAGLAGGGRLCWLKRRFFLAEGRRRNIHTIGGVRSGDGASRPDWAPRGPSFLWIYMNSTLKNVLKILLGFAPAALTFQLTKNWWLLAWFGPFIWFGITGARNVIQSVLGSGGLKRSPLIKWSSYVSWERLSDSLLWTGFSVPLLDYLVKTVMLDRGMGVNTATNPVLLYTIMALVNGLYISGHNTLRGLPRKAAVGNFFRSVLSIPLAVVFNAAAGALLGATGVAAVQEILQKWAAIISKFASDCVAGVIEGLADRTTHIRLRTRDIDDKLGQIFAAYSRMEMLHPRKNVMKMLESPKDLLRAASREPIGMKNVVIVNALDMLHMWMHQPRTATVMKRKLRSLSQDERKVFLLSLYVLRREKEICTLLIEGLLGRKFKTAMAFYLSNYERFIDDIQGVAARMTVERRENEADVLLN